MVVAEFTGKYRFLSNFYPSVVRLDDDEYAYPTAEHAYQASKTIFRPERREVLKCRTPGEAKRFGRKVTIRPDWEQIKLDVMLRVLQVKFQDQVLKGKLLATGDMELVEGNYWGDTFWGKMSGVGENHLGRLLMQVRNELK